MQKWMVWFVLLAGQSFASDTVLLHLKPSRGTCFTDSVSFKLRIQADSKKFGIAWKTSNLREISETSPNRVSISSACRYFKVMKDQSRLNLLPTLPRINASSTTVYDHSGMILGWGRIGAIEPYIDNPALASTNLYTGAFKAACDGNIGKRSMYLFRLPDRPLALGSTWQGDDEALFSVILRPLGIRDFPARITFKLKSMTMDHGARIARVTWDSNVTRTGSLVDKSGDPVLVSVHATQSGFVDIDVASGLALASKYQVALTFETDKRQSSIPHITGFDVVVETKASAFRRLSKRK